MALDGEKLRKIRNSKGMSQEKLALMANVNKRTIQRAENGAAIALETVAFIADAVGVAPETLRGRQSDLFENDKKAWNEVVLVPTTSGRKVIDLVRTSFETETEYDVEPTKENIEPLAKLASLIEPFIPAPWQNPFDNYDPSQSEVLEKQAEVNEILPILGSLGITVFVGKYTACRQIPRYDMDEGHTYIRDNFAPEAVQVTIVLVSDTSSTHLLRKPKDIYSDYGAEIPF